VWGVLAVLGWVGCLVLTIIVVRRCRRA
jgi:hypothetical protein